MRFHRTLLATSAIALAFGAAACSSSDDAATDTAATEAPAEAPATDAAADADAPAASENAVTISGSRFGPTELVVSAGSTVTFTNTDPFAHTVTSKDDAPAQFDSENLGGDATFDVEFAEAGTYNYFCQIHPTMRASVVVN